MPLFTPTFFTQSVTDITPQTLKYLKISSVILDIDDTLTDHGSPKVSEKISKWIDSLKLSGIKIILVSNNFRNRVKKFAAKLDVPYVYMGLKPFTFGVNKALKILKSGKKEALVIGDQVFTDIIAANFSGIRSVLTSPLSKSKTFMLKFKRFFEKPLRKKIISNYAPCLKSINSDKEQNT